MTTTMTPTDEQLAALDLFREGETMVIDAGAGTGKTSTLMLLASDTKAIGQYLAFNKAIVSDVQRKLPETCNARTAHSLAYGVVGKHFSHRLRSQRIRSEHMARLLGLPECFRINYGGEPKDLTGAYLAGTVMNTLRMFCQTADETPGLGHFRYIDGVDVPTIEGKRTWANNDRLRDFLLPYLEKAWADVQNVDGQLRYEHAHYLKVWQLRDPKIPADYIMFDEAQDASPVMADIVAKQTHAQCVYVGDRNQAIYGFTGAIDAMEGFDSQHRRALTQSFRFGPAIALEANMVLAQLGSELMVRGLPDLASVVDRIDGYPDTVLCRTNASTITHALHALDEGHPFHLVGGGKELIAFARGAKTLGAPTRPSTPGVYHGRASHHDLACFANWSEVKDYVDHDPEGAELKLLVGLIEKNGTDTIIEAIEQMVPEGPGVLSISTAHKSKGREWDRVRLDLDMGLFGDSEDELRLRYVAMTRARLHLDLSLFEEGLAQRDARARR